MPHSIVFTPEAEDQLAALYSYIREKASAEIALRYTSAIIEHCESLRDFPRRAVRRDDIRSGLHITHYKGRVVIAFTVDDERVAIIGVFYGGRDYETILHSEEDD
jgi:plasmid stabilization system protein ParE